MTPQTLSFDVLIVEDDADLLNSLAFAFEVEGFNVHPYLSAEALLADGVLPAHGCLVVDHRLPGMSGLSLLRSLREQGCVLPSVLITTSNAEIARCAERCGVEIIDKPLLSDVLIDKVRSLGASAG